MIIPEFSEYIQESQRTKTDILNFFRKLLNSREIEKIKTTVIDNGLMKEHSYKVKHNMTVNTCTSTIPKPRTHFLRVII